MKFEVRINVETEEEFDEATLEMCIVSQLLGGLVSLKVEGIDAGEVDEFEQVGVLPLRKGDLVVDANDNLYSVREVTPEGVYVDDYGDGQVVDAGCFALDELALDMTVEDQRNKLFPYG